MNKKSLKFKATTFLLITFMMFLSLNKINNHTFSIGFSNFHFKKCPKTLTCCFRNVISHSNYTCSKTFHF